MGEEARDALAPALPARGLLGAQSPSIGAQDCTQKQHLSSSAHRIHQARGRLGLESTGKVGRLRATAQPHCSRDKGCFPSLKRLSTSFPKSCGWRRPARHGWRATAQLGWSSADDSEKGDPNTPQSQSTALSSALAQTTDPSSGPPDPRAHQIPLLTNPTAQPHSWESAHFSLLCTPNSQPTIYRITFSF